VKFSSYSNIENAYRLKFVNDIIENGLAYGDWCVTEKIHGSNFSFYVDIACIKCAKRGNFIGDGEKNFYGHKDVLNYYNSNLCALFHMLSELYNIPEDKLEYILYGEIFGGLYPHKDVPKSKIATKVQRGVFYSPDNDFYAFDLKVNGSFVNFKIFEELMDVAGFLWAKSLFIGDMKSCLTYPNEFQTKIPEILELPTMENNICEGVVIKPLDARFFPSGDRVILKNKNDKFKEVSTKKSKQKIDGSSIELISLSDENKAVVADAESYITENRLRNVISKIGSVTNKDFGKLLGLFTQDVLKDFRKDKEDILSSIDKDRIKLIQNHIKTLCADMIRTNFSNIIDGLY
jgi:Rnl2 family RNA ligase